MTFVKWRNYGYYSSYSYGVHTLAFEDVYGNTYWFSYDTLVAYRINGEFHILKNYWGTTTGKHLNWIDPDKSKRESQEDFDRRLSFLTCTDDVERMKFVS